MSRAPFSMYSVTIMTCLSEKKQQQNEMFKERKALGPVMYVISDEIDKLTFGHNSLQANDIRVRELSHDARLAQEILPLFL